MKKKILALILIVITAYSAYYDVTTGTLPEQRETADKSVEVSTTDQEIPNIPFFEEEVQPGDTLLSIMEEHDGQLGRPIEIIIADFNQLNNDASPHMLIIGKSYKFPTYK
ncbi:MAG: hypothetical protein ACI4XL_09190 [Bacillus sp. (in: firmicutes)]